MKIVARRERAFTRVELVMVVGVVAVLTVIFLAGMAVAESKSHQVACLNNLKQIGLAHCLWAAGNGFHFPAAMPETNGGWRERLNRPDAAASAWMDYKAIGVELGLNPKTLVCPADERRPALGYAAVVNTNISYFISPDAIDNNPRSILGGDRNLGAGTSPAPDYGYSPADGRGNDVIITGPVCWSAKMHSESGYILLGNGGVEPISSGNLSEYWLNPSTVNTNYNAAGRNTAGIRLIFP